MEETNTVTSDYVRMVNYQSSFEIYLKKGEADFAQVEKELKRTLMVAMTLKQCPEIELSENEVILVKLALGIQKNINRDIKLSTEV